MTWEECLNIRSVQNSQEICVQLSIHPVLPGFTQYEGLGCDLDICVFIIQMVKFYLTPNCEPVA